MSLWPCRHIVIATCYIQVLTSIQLPHIMHYLFCKFCCANPTISPEKHDLGEPFSIGINQNLSSIIIITLKLSKTIEHTYDWWFGRAMKSPTPRHVPFCYTLYSVCTLFRTVLPSGGLPLSTTIKGSWAHISELI